MSAVVGRPPLLALHLSLHLVLHSCRSCRPCRGNSASALRRSRRFSSAVSTRARVGLAASACVASSSSQTPCFSRPTHNHSPDPHHTASSGFFGPPRPRFSPLSSCPGRRARRNRTGNARAQPRRLPCLLSVCSPLSNVPPATHHPLPRPHALHPRHRPCSPACRCVPLPWCVPAAALRAQVVQALTGPAAPVCVSPRPAVVGVVLLPFPPSPALPCRLRRGPQYSCLAPSAPCIADTPPPGRFPGALPPVAGGLDEDAQHARRPRRGTASTRARTTIAVVARPRRLVPGLPRGRRRGICAAHGASLALSPRAPSGGSPARHPAVTPLPVDGGRSQTAGEPAPSDDGSSLSSEVSPPPPPR